MRARFADEHSNVGQDTSLLCRCSNFSILEPTGQAGLRTVITSVGASGVESGRCF